MEFPEGCSSLLPPAPQCIVRMKRYFFGFSFVSSSSSWVKRGLPGRKWLVESAQRWLFMLHSDQNFPDTPELPGNRTGIRPANRREKRRQGSKQQFRSPARLTRTPAGTGADPYSPRAANHNKEISSLTWGCSSTLTHAASVGCRGRRVG